jgi:hypothetical protein
MKEFSFNYAADTNLFFKKNSLSSGGGFPSVLDKNVAIDENHELISRRCRTASSSKEIFLISRKKRSIFSFLVMNFPLVARAERFDAFRLALLAVFSIVSLLLSNTKVMKSPAK